MDPRRARTALFGEGSTALLGPLVSLVSMAAAQQSASASGDVRASTEMCSYCFGTQVRARGPSFDPRGAYTITTPPTDVLRAYLQNAAPPDPPFDTTSQWYYD